MDVSIIATLYSYEPVIASVTKFGANNLYLLIDKVPDDVQNEAIKRVKELLEKYVKIHFVKTDVYDIVKIAKECVTLIDQLKKDSKILLNVSSARKTKAFGLMFAGYTRAKDVEKIFYITKEDQKVVLLPKIAFNLNDSQKKVLDFLNDGRTFESLRDIYNSLNISRSMFYKTISELKDMGFVENNNITDAGRIVLL
jgi:CRISPR locus-related DNA-binding protein